MKLAQVHPKFDIYYFQDFQCLKDLARNNEKNIFKTKIWDETVHILNMVSGKVDFLITHNPGSQVFLCYGTTYWSKP